jgi:hypothetical protein
MPHPMPYPRLPNRSDEYRRRAEEARAAAATAADDEQRAALLQVAETWERMARWEDLNNPSPQG